MNKNLIKETIATMNSASADQFNMCFFGAGDYPAELAYPCHEVDGASLMDYIDNKLFPDERKRLMICSLQLYHDTDTVNWPEAFKMAGLAWPENALA